MSEPQKLLDSSESELVLRLLRSGTMERPAAQSLERTMLTLGRQSGIVQRSSRSRQGAAARARRHGVVAALALLAFTVSSVVSYLW